MFIENSLLHFIEADVQDVAAMYRSNSSIMLDIGGRPRQPCEAFICVTNDGDSTSVYVALSLLHSKSFVIFVPKKQPHDKGTSDLIIKEAHDFVKEFGFDMQSINLNYSKALKEVVLNDLRVVRSGTSGKKPSVRKGAADKTSRQQHDDSLKVPDAEDNAVEKVKTSSLEQEKKVTKAPVDTPSSRESEQGSSSLKSAPGVNTDLIEELARKDRLVADKAKAEKDAAHTLALLRAETQQLEKEIVVLEDTSKAEIAAVKAGLEDLARKKAAAETHAEKELAKLHKDSQRLSEQIASQEKSEEVKLTALAADIEELTQAKKDAEKDASRKIVAAKAEIDSLKAEITDHDRETSAEMAALQAELEQLSLARSSAEKERAREIAVLKTELEGFALQPGTDQELESLRNELERRRGDKSASENSIQAELSELQLQRATLDGEITALEVQGQEELSAMRAELEERAREKQRVSDELEQELLSVRSEIEQILSDSAGTRDVVAEELAALEAERKRLLREKENAEKSAAVELADLRAEIVRLADEQKSVEESCAATCADLNAEAERLAAEKSLMQKESDDEQHSLQERILMLQDEIAAARDLTEKLLTSLRQEEETLLTSKKEGEVAASAEISSLEEELSHLRKAIDSDRADKEKKISGLKAGIEKLSLERISFEENLEQEIDSLSAQEEQLTGQLVIDEAAAAEKLAAAQSRVSTISAEIKKKNDSAKEKLSSISAEIERLEREGDVRANEAAAQMTALKARLLQFADDLLQSEKQIAEKTLAARNTARSLVAALSGDEKEFVENAADPDLKNWVAALQQEAEQLTAEKNALENTSTGEVALLRAKVTSLAAEKLAVEKNLAREMESLHLEAERLVSEKAAAEKAAKSVLGEITADVERLAGEKASAEKLIGERISAAKATALKLIDEKAELEKQEEFTSVPQNEISPTNAQIAAELVPPDAALTMETAGSASLSLPTTPLNDVSIDDDFIDAAVVASNTSKEIDETDPFAFLQKEGAFDFGSQPRLGRKTSGKSVPFAIDKSKMRIGYQHPEDVLEVYKSLNRTRVARDDNTTVTCDAYVFSLREDGMPHVYIAFYLVDSKEVMVYVPEIQPATEEEFAGSMSDGFDFIEIVGFMMDPMDLGHDVETRKKKLSKIPVLQRITTAE